MERAGPTIGLCLRPDLTLRKRKPACQKYIDGLKAGDRIILCRRNRPVAEILPLPEPEGQPRPIGLGAGLAEISETFFDPLPDEMLELFEGRSGGATEHP